MAISDVDLSNALRLVLRMNCGFYVGFAEMLEIGQLENLKYWVTSRDHDNNELWSKDDLTLDAAIQQFLRIRHERQLGFDIELDLNPGLGPVGSDSNEDA